MAPKNVQHAALHALSRLSISKESATRFIRLEKKKGLHDPFERGRRCERIERTAIEPSTAPRAETAAKSCA
jgi:hypothetical protein